METCIIFFFGGGGGGGEVPYIDIHTHIYICIYLLFVNVSGCCVQLCCP